MGRNEGQGHRVGPTCHLLLKARSPETCNHRAVQDIVVASLALRIPGRAMITTGGLLRGTEGKFLRFVRCRMQKVCKR